MKGTSIFAETLRKDYSLYPYPYAVDIGQAEPTSTKLAGLSRDLEWQFIIGATLVIIWLVLLVGMSI